MSWLNLNDSLNALKGQISNFAQEVLAEESSTVVGEGEDSTKKLEEACVRIDELSNLCTTQDTELTLLRRQIAELQQQQKTVEPSTSSLSKSETNAGTTEDSWFWEADNNTSSSSSKNENEIISKSTSGGDLTIIPLDTAVENELVEKLKRKLVDCQQKLEKKGLENAVLNEKLAQTTNENRELNENIDELDKQHDAAIEGLLVVKNQLQEKYNKLQKEQENFSTIGDEVTEIRRQNEKLENLYQAGVQESQSQQQLILDMKKELENAILQNNELTALLEAKEEILKGLANLRNENLISEQQYIELKKSNLNLQNEMLELKNQLEDSSMFSEQYDEIQKRLTAEKSKSDKLEHELEIVIDANSDLRKKLEKSEQDYRQLLLEKETELEDFKNLLEKSEKSERALHTQIIDLQSSLNSKSIEVGQPLETSLQLHEIKELINRFSTFESTTINDERKYLEEFLKTVRDSQSKINALEKKLLSITEEKDKIVHEKETVQADLMHYEVECAELMKNNEILLGELEILKSGKLETIPENNEESLIQLEKQLEDCSNLNQSLEDEYMEVRQKLEDAEVEKEKIVEKMATLVKDVEEKNKKQHELQTQIECLENEKSNLVFEINELKTDDNKALHESEIQEYKEKIMHLESQLARLNSDHSELVTKLQSLTENAVEQRRKSEEIITEQKRTIDEKSIKLQEEHEIHLKLANELEQIKQSAGESNNLVEHKFAEELTQIRNELSNKTDEIKKFDRLLKEKDENYLATVEETKRLNEQIAKLQNELLDATQNDQLISENQILKTNYEALTKEKNDMISLITVKHNESLQYHAEMQRLVQLFHIETEKSKNLSDQVTSLQSNSFSNDEREKMQDQITFLREKSDIMTKNLLTEQTNQKLVTQEKQEIIEQKNILARDIERLRQHLLEVEEAHTEETMELQKILEENKLKIAQLEEDAKKSSTAYTSANIRANQQTETLHTQYLLLQQQRDDLSGKLSQAEDRESKNQAALINLQCALEQFQKEKDRDIEMATIKLRNDLQNERVKEKELSNEIQNLQHQLAEAKNGLLAASRISDQLEMSQITITTLKTELMKAQDKYIVLENKLHDVQTNQADKVEKSLIKNLLIGYVVSSNGPDKLQILKLISSVLDFNQTETDRVGLNKSHSGWLNSVISGVSGPPGGPQNADYNRESLTQAFVKFLEKESSPRAKPSEMPTLLNIRRPSTNLAPQPVSTGVLNADQQTATNDPSSATSTAMPPLSSQQTPQPVQPILLNESVLTNFAPSRNSSSILKEILHDS